jgi:hypothetical protein
MLQDQHVPPAQDQYLHLSRGKRAKFILLDDHANHGLGIFHFRSLRRRGRFKIFSRSLSQPSEGRNLGNPLRLDLSPVRQLGFYDRLLEEYKGKTSTSTEDICAEVYQRLYARYQSDKDIASLRRVFQVYSFKNAELGYCQAWSPLFFGLRTESRG